MKILKRTPPCTICGKRFVIDPYAQLPAMVGFVKEDGTALNICRKCLMKYGSMTEEERLSFNEKHGIKR